MHDSQQTQKNNEHNFIFVVLLVQRRMRDVGQRVTTSEQTPVGNGLVKRPCAPDKVSPTTSHWQRTDVPDTSRVDV